MRYSLRIKFILKNDDLPDDVIDIIWNAFPEVTYQPRVALVDA